MASSVSSEHAFSSAGITISKCCNRLKGDIVEALQCLKCMYHSKLIFHRVVTSAQVEAELEEMELFEHEKRSTDVCKEAESFTWDDLVIDVNKDDSKDDDNDVIVLN